MNSKFRCLLGSLALVLAAGCAAITPHTDPNAAADQIAQAGGLKKTTIKTKSFTITAWFRSTRPGDAMNLYIEGDGAAWRSRTWLSEDPTPRNPLVLELAGIDPAPNVVYLARPGQYAAADALPCDPAYWSDKRFSREVVEALNEATDALAADIRSVRINLIGYSGGAALAVLLATRRSDVVSLRTVAGNLDPEALNRYHHVSPLKDALNPMDCAAKLSGLPQRHFIGAEDDVVPPFIAQSFVKRAGSKEELAITVVEDATHAKGWRDRWRSLLTLPLRDHSY